MLKNRGVMLALSGAGLLLAACSSSPPPAPPAPMPAPPPPPDYSGVYTGKATWAKGCHYPANASMTVQGTSFNLPLGKGYTFTGPVGQDGSVSATVEAVPASGKGKRRHGGMAAGDLSGQIANNAFNGQAHIGKCTGQLSLQKAAGSS